MDPERLLSNAQASHRCAPVCDRRFLSQSARPRIPCLQTLQRCASASQHPANNGKLSVQCGALRRNAKAAAVEPVLDSELATLDSLLHQQQQQQQPAVPKQQQRRFRFDVSDRVQQLERTFNATPSMDAPPVPARTATGRLSTRPLPLPNVAAAAAAPARGVQPPAATAAGFEAPVDSTSVLVPSTRRVARRRSAGSSPVRTPRSSKDGRHRRGARAGASSGRTSVRTSAAAAAVAPLAPAGPASGKAGKASTRRGRPPKAGLALDGNGADLALVSHLRNRLDAGRRQFRRGGGASTSDAVSMFMHNIGNTGILTKDEEAGLARVMRRGVDARATAAEIAEQLGRPATEAELAAELAMPSAAALRRLLAAADEARELMVQYNVRLVVSIAKKYVGRGIDFGDLIPEGMLGLSKAVDKFDPSKGFKFSTYAHWWIRQAVTRCISDHSRVVRLPVHVYDILGKINRAAAELNGQAGRTGPASYHEIGSALGIPAAKVLQYLKAAKPARSLDTPAYSSGSHRSEAESQLLVDTVATQALPEADEYKQAIDKIVREDINALLSTLPPRERNVIRMRYGLHNADGKSMTFNDIGAAYGLTKERIRQIEDKALSKLKRPWRRKLLRPQLYLQSPEL